MNMAKRNGAAGPDGSPGAVSWAERYKAAHRAAEQEIADLPPGEAILYHEGNLAIDATHDATVAGRAAAFREAIEASEGTSAQRRLGFERYQYIFWRGRREQR